MIKQIIFNSKTVLYTINILFVLEMKHCTDKLLIYLNSSVKFTRSRLFHVMYLFVRLLLGHFPWYNLYAEDEGKSHDKLMAALCVCCGESKSKFYSVRSKKFALYEIELIMKSWEKSNLYSNISKFYSVRSKKFALYEIK